MQNNNTVYFNDLNRYQKKRIVEHINKDVKDKLTQIINEWKKGKGSLNENLESEMIAYHGTDPSERFEKFDRKFIGSGQGANAFGYGIYVSINKETGRNYAYIAERAHKYQNIFNGNRLLYTVEIPDDNGSNYVDWYNTTESQLDTLKAKVRQYCIELINARLNDSFKGKENAYVEKESARRIGNLDIDLENCTDFGDLYETVADLDNSEEKASIIFNKIGLTGVRFTPRNETYLNYVIFDPDDVKVREIEKV